MPMVRGVVWLAWAENSRGSACVSVRVVGHQTARRAGRPSPLLLLMLLQWGRQRASAGPDNSGGGGCDGAAAVAAAAAEGGLSREGDGRVVAEPAAGRRSLSRAPATARSPGLAPASSSCAAAAARNPSRRGCPAPAPAPAACVGSRASVGAPRAGAAERGRGLGLCGARCLPDTVADRKVSAVRLSRPAAVASAGTGGRVRRGRRGGGERGGCRLEKGCGGLVRRVRIAQRDERGPAQFDSIRLKWNEIEIVRESQDNIRRDGWGRGLGRVCAQTGSCEVPGTDQ